MARQQELSRAHRRTQAGLRSQVVRDALTVWNAVFDPSRPDESFRVARDLLIALIRDRYPVSVRTAEAFYRQIRALAIAGDFTTEFQPVTAPQPPAEQLQASLAATGLAAYYTALGGGQSPQEAKDTSGVTVSGATSRLVLSGGRETVHRSVEADPRAVGYIRVTDEDPCGFCAMLASRGPVYKSLKTAGDTRGGGKRYHDHDACFAAPVYEGSDNEWTRRSADLSDQWARVTAGLSGEQARNAWRSYWEKRHAD